MLDSTDDTLRRALVRQPEMLGALTDLHQTARAAIDADLLDLCQARIASLLGFDTPSPTAQNPPQQACLDLVDQFVIDVAGMTDELVAAVTNELGGDGMVTFVNALLVIEQRLRVQRTFTRLLPELGS